jgi:hypothetical protein
MTIAKHMVTESFVPDEWLRLLRQLQDVCPEIILAGGCLRDHYIGREVKDLDFFAPFEAEKALRNLIKTQLPSWGGVSTTDGVESAACDDTVSKVDDYGKFQIIYCTEKVSPIERFEQFDFGLCQVACDGRHVLTTENFSDDYFHSRFTLLRASNYAQFLDSLNRYSRLRIKYPGWPLIIPPDLELPVEITEYKHPRRKGYDDDKPDWA